MRSALTSLMLGTAILSATAPVFAKADAAGSGKAAPLPPADASPLPPAVDPAVVTGDGTALPPIVDGAPLAPVLNADGTPLAPVNNGGTPVTSAAEVKAKADRVKPQLTAVLAGLPMPKATVAVNKVGAQTLYNFDGLVNVGDSFGIMNKTANDIASTITGANKRYKVQAKNDDGSLKFTTAEPTAIKDAAGNPVLDAAGAPVMTKPEPEPVMIDGKKFKAFDIYTGSEPGPKGEEVYYPATTPDDQRAPCRVFRIA